MHYHNDLHGADVAQHVSFVINRQELGKTAKFNELDRLTLIVSSLCHDVQHDGFTNGFHKKAESPLQQNFGDDHIQEYFHAAQAIKLLSMPECDFLSQSFSKY